MATSFTYQEDTQTLIGQRPRELIDRETGEVIMVDQITKRVYGTKAFWKVYLADFLQILGIFDSKQLDVFIYIVSHTDPGTNVFLGTYKEIAKHCEVSEPTIAKIMKKLREKGFIAKRPEGKGIYYVNPNILMKGNDTKRQILLSYYASNEPVNSIEVARTMRESIKEDVNGVKYQETPPLLTESDKSAPEKTSDWRSEPATERQLKKIAELEQQTGRKFNGKTKGEASEFITATASTSAQ